jgi:sec-independent protein translocase protein TatC
MSAMKLRTGMRRDRERRPKDASMTFLEHLVELRSRLIVTVIAVAVGTVIAWLGYGYLLKAMLHPYRQALHDPNATLLITDPLEGIATRFKVSAYGGLVLASPIVLWQIWRFVTPGLNPNEKRYAIPFILSSITLFLCGAFVAVLTIKPALVFLQSVGGPGLHTIYAPGKYLTLVTLMMVAFGVAFELPVVLVFLEIAGVLQSARLRKWRRPAAVIITAFAAVITPSADPYSLFAMAIPMYLFYEAAILIGRALGK